MARFGTHGSHCMLWLLLAPAGSLQATEARPGSSGRSTHCMQSKQVTFRLSARAVTREGRLPGAELVQAWPPAAHPQHWTQRRPCQVVWAASGPALSSEGQALCTTAHCSMLPQLCAGLVYVSVHSRPYRASGWRQILAHSRCAAVVEGLVKSEDRAKSPVLRSAGTPGCTAGQAPSSWPAQGCGWVRCRFLSCAMSAQETSVQSCASQASSVALCSSVSCWCAAARPLWAASASAARWPAMARACRRQGTVRTRAPQVGVHRAQAGTQQGQAAHIPAGCPPGQPGSSPCGPRRRQ